MPHYTQQLITERPGFFVDIFLGVSLSQKFEKELLSKMRISANRFSQKADLSSSSDSSSDDSSSDSSSSSSSSEEDGSPDNDKQRKRSKTDSLKGNLPIIFEAEKEKPNIIEEKKPEENEMNPIPIMKEEEKQEIGEDFVPHRSRTTFQKKKPESPKKKGTEIINGLAEINKSTDYKYLELLFKPFEEGSNDVILGYMQKIIVAFLSKKAFEVYRFLIITPI